MNIGQEFKAVDRLGLVSTWILESVGDDGIFKLRATRETLEKCKKDIETFRNYRMYDEKKEETFITICVKQNWFDNRKIELLKGE